MRTGSSFNYRRKDARCPIAMERETISPLAQFASIRRHFSIGDFGSSVANCEVAAEI
jgi:hypothetical protein